MQLAFKYVILIFKPLNAELNPICHILALFGAHHILHFSRISVKNYLYRSECVNLEDI
jgi:hypothetical protein